MQLRGKVALITGSSRGIGAACARRLAQEGASVVVHYHKQAEMAEQVRGDIVAGGGKATIRQADLTEPTEVRALVQSAMDAFGRLDIVVNNAGIGEVGKLDSIDAAHILRHFAVNVASVLLVTQAAARFFGADGGSVINISSINANRPVPGASVYSASKAAVDALTRSLASELAPRRVRVNAVAPGATDTAMLRSVLQSGAESVVVQHTLLGQRLGQPEDIAAVVAFLAGPDSEWITGQVLNASGGLQI